MTATPIETHVLPRNGDIPNSELPLVLYRNILADPSGDLARAFEDRFRLNGWTGSWRNGILAFHHFHAGAHEVLGVAAGRASVQFGGEGGVVAEVAAGDAVVIPAGVGHKCLERDVDFLVVGAYPPGQDPGITREGEPGPREAGADRPPSDPIFGPDGPLVSAWTA
ncbi:cupin [Prosthecomicrobium sp. N25]|uniref:cupin n=1 Tax=Prosthecomicrobium sp. N25 TaxID=3129254 RepID=UPI0030769884